MKKEVRWAVVGAGGIADRRTLPAMMQAENTRLAAVMDTDPKAAEACRLKYGAELACTDLDPILQDPDIDAVYIASPVFAHAEQVRRIADRGKHILVEKPIALNAEEGAALLDYCRERKVLLAAGYMMRFGAHVRHAKALIAEGAIGRVVSAVAQFSCWYPDMKNSWRQVKKLGGGGSLMDMGGHCIDLIQYVLGSRAKKVTAINDTLSFSYGVEDSSSVCMQLENGAICTVNTNFNIPDAASQWRLDFFGTKGCLLGERIIGQEDGGTLRAVFADDSSAYDAQQNTVAAQMRTLTSEFGDMYRREIESFNRSVLYGEPLEAPAEDAVQVQRVIEAAYASSDSAAAVIL